MAEDKKISGLPLATTPLAGTEEQEIIQGGVNKRVAVSNVGGSGAAASETTPGIAELATQAETNTGTDDARIVTPLKLANYSGWSGKLDSLSSFRTETASYTLDATDLAAANDGSDLDTLMDVASANVVTIPLNATQAFPIGFKKPITQIGAGQTSIAATGGVTINSANGWVKIAYQYASVLLTKTATDTWLLEGALTP